MYSFAAWGNKQNGNLMSLFPQKLQCYLTEQFWSDFTSINFICVYFIVLHSKCIEFAKKINISIFFLKRNKLKLSSFPLYITPKHTSAYRHFFNILYIFVLKFWASQQIIKNECTHLTFLLFDTCSRLTLGKIIFDK